MLSRFRQCVSDKDLDNDGDILRECASPDIQIIKRLGEGAYGIAYLAKYKNKLICIKSILTEAEYDDTANNENLDDLYFEVEYSYNMGQQDIGPKVYYAFFYKNYNEDIITYILMEAFDMSVGDAYKSGSFTENQLIDITEQMLHITHKQVYYNHMFCVDVKPVNFVLKKAANGSIVVRMIDFGKDWCTLGTYPKEYLSIDYFYFVITVQLFMLVLDYICRSGNKLSDNILKPFFQTHVAKRYLTEENANNVKAVLYNVLRKSENRRIHIKYLMYVVPKRINSDEFYKSFVDKLVDYLLYCKSLFYNFKSPNLSPKRYSRQKRITERKFFNPSPEKTRAKSPEKIRVKSPAKTRAKSPEKVPQKTTYIIDVFNTFFRRAKTSEWR
jgi:serine/threonine protein kinase